MHSKKLGIGWSLAIMCKRMWFGTGSSIWQINLLSRIKVLICWEWPTSFLKDSMTRSQRQWINYNLYCLLNFYKSSFKLKNVICFFNNLSSYLKNPNLLVNFVTNTLIFILFSLLSWWCRVVRRREELLGKPWEKRVSVCYRLSITVRSMGKII